MWAHNWAQKKVRKQTKINVTTYEGFDFHRWSCPPVIIYMDTFQSMFLTKNKNKSISYLHFTVLTIIFYLIIYLITYE